MCNSHFVYGIYVILSIACRDGDGAHRMLIMPFDGRKSLRYYIGGIYQNLDIVVLVKLYCDLDPLFA